MNKKQTCGTQSPNERKIAIDFIKSSNDNKIEFSSSKFIEFVEKLGVRKVKIGTEFELVVVQNYIVQRITTSEVKDLVLQYVKELKNDRFTDYLLNKTTLFSMKYLDAVATIELKMHRDKPGKSYFYFKNGVVKVTSKKIYPPVPYGNFKRLIWKDHIIDREFNPSIDTEEKPPVFEDFINKLSNNNQEHFFRICSIIGYCLFDYKTAATSRAVIINDQSVSSNPEGGSGKSLIVSAIAQLRKTIFCDGKNFDPKATFAWQKVDESTRILCLDDVKKGFNFEGLFALITSGFRNINKKNKQELELSIEDSPLIIITTNYVLRGNSGSFSRRQYLLEIYPYFHSGHTPNDEYGQIFFSEWDELEWAKFDAFMLNCVQFFLKHGVTEYTEHNSLQKELIRATSQAFAEWIEDNLEELTVKSGVSTVTMRDRFLNDANLRGTPLSDRKFIEYMKSYCKIYNYSFKSIRINGTRGFQINSHA
jgi:hypothetical protein